MRDDSLAQLFQLIGILQHVTKFRLPEQKYLQQGLTAKLEIRQHPQFFQRPCRQILRFINDQQTAAPGTRFGVEKFFNRAEQLRLVHMVGIDIEMIGCDADDILAVELGRDDIRGGQTRLVDRRHQMADQRGLASTDITGDHDKPLALCQAVAKIGQGLAMRQALEIIMRIGGQLKRPTVQSIKCIIHTRISDHQR